MKKATGFGSAGMPTRDQVRKWQEQTARSIVERGRAIVSVLPQGVTLDDEDKQPAFSYSLGNDLPHQETRVPEVLLIYPSAPTASFLINNVSDAMVSGEIEAFREGEKRQVLGFLGEGGKIPFRARLLNAMERVDAWDHSNYTCQLPGPKTPVLLIEIPDPSGHWPEEPECAEPVREAYEAARFKVGPVEVA